MISYLMAYLLDGSGLIHWIRDLESEMHSNMRFVVKWPSKMQEECFFFVFGRGEQLFSDGIEEIPGGCRNLLPRPDLTSLKVRGRTLMSSKREF